METELKKKPSLTERAIKNQKTIIVVAVICIITLFIGSSYSLLTNFDTSDNFVTFKEGPKAISATKIDGVIKFLKNYDKDESYDSVRPVVLTFQNEGREKTNYKVRLKGVKNAYLNDEDIMFTVSTDLGVSYDEAVSLSQTNGVIYNGIDLDIDTSKTIYLKMWYVGDKVLNVTNNTYEGSLKIDF